MERDEHAQNVWHTVSEMYLKFLTMCNEYKTIKLFNHGPTKMVQWVKYLVSKSLVFWPPHAHYSMHTKIYPPKIHSKCKIYLTMKMIIFSFLHLHSSFSCFFIFYFSPLFDWWDIVSMCSPRSSEIYYSLEWPKVHCNLHVSAFQYTGYGLSHHTRPESDIIISNSTKLAV